MSEEPQAARGTCSICHATYANGERFCPLDGGAVVSELADRADPLIGTTIDGRYLIRRLLGRGGMGAVYEAHHVGLDKRVAIKLVLDADADALARFRREARAGSRIAHDHVIQIFDVGRHGDRDYIVMEYVEGRDLRTALQNGPFEPARAAAIGRQILDGLHAIHEAGIVHRDIKPGNILLANRDDDFVTIMDFGISKAAMGTAEAITKSNQVVGTPEFMAPEQLSGGEVDRRADLYAVGLTIYAMVTGEAPFVATSFTELAAKQLRDIPPALADLRPDVPPALSSAVAHALAKSPAARFATAAEFADALRGIATPRPAARSAATVVDKPHEATRAERPSARAEPADRSRRTARTITLAIALVIAAGVGAFALVWWLRNHNNNRAPRDATVVVATGDVADPFAPAIAAEHDGKLELAIARYVEAYDAHRDPQILYRIAELYERLDRAQDAIAYFRTYLDTSPRDAGAVRARIARLQPPVASDAGTAAPPHAAPVSHSCGCKPDDAKRHPGFVCRAQQHTPPICRCELAGDNLCPDPFQPCAEPCAISNATTEGKKFACTTKTYAAYAIPATAGAACKGYSTRDVFGHANDSSWVAPLRDGAYACDFCRAKPLEPSAERDTHFVFAGRTGEVCHGVNSSTGESLPGHLVCDAN